MIAAIASRQERMDATIRWLAATVLFLLLAVSPMALSALGWNYDAPGGSGPMRFHPATYLTLLLLLAITLRDGNPVTSIAGMFAADTLTSIYLVAWSILLWHGTAHQTLPAASLVDTFLLPALLLLCYRRLDEPTISTMRMLSHFAMAMNALLGLGEFLSGLRLTPYVAGGIAISDDWRSTALLGHPLGNALLTGCYAATLIIGGGGLMPRPRIAMLVLQCLAMVAFGGRTSLAILALFVAGAVTRAGLRFLAGGGIPLRLASMLAFALPIAIGALFALHELGFFDKLLLRFVEDRGSTEARIVMFELFRGFTWTELLLGPPQDQLAFLVRIHKLEFGIESLWIAFSLYYGILPASLFFLGLALFMLSLLQHCRARAWLIVAYYFAVNSTFLGIAGKTTGFTTLCMMLLLMLPRRAGGDARC